MDEIEERQRVIDKVCEYCAQEMTGLYPGELPPRMRREIEYRAREYVPLILRALKEIQDGQDRVEADSQ